MKNLLNISFIIITLLFSSCYKWSDGDYFISKMEGTSCYGLDLSLSSNTSIGRINCVLKIWSNKEYIIAYTKELPISKGYFVIDKSADNMYYNGNEITKGPYNEIQIDSLKKSLNLSFDTWDWESL